MKKIFPLISAIALSLTTTVASADEGFYIGAISGVVESSISELDTDTLYGLQAGYAFENNFAIEAEYTFTDVTLGNASGDLSTLAMYGVYRTKGDLYGKFKAGVLNEKVSMSTKTNSGIELDDTGLSAGIGAGYKFGNFSIEAEYVLH